MRLPQLVLVALLSIGFTQSVRAADAPASQPAKVQPVDFRKLKELMPETLSGQKRTNNEGQKVSLGEFVFTQATAQFRDDSKEEAPSYEVQIMDYAASKEMAAAMTAWQSIEVDREGDDGYERTTKINGQPAYESYNKGSKSGQIQVFVAGRFYVNVSANNVAAEDMKKIAESLPIAKLAELK